MPPFRQDGLFRREEAVRVSGVLKGWVRPCLFRRMSLPSGGRHRGVEKKGPTGE